jgi:hypothetical protein
MKTLAKATANKKLYIEITNINGNISGETNDFITIKYNNKFARTNNNFTIPKINQFTVEHNNKIYNIKTKVGTYIK